MTLKDRIIVGLSTEFREMYASKELRCFSYLDTEEMSHAVEMVANLFAEAARYDTGDDWDGVTSSQRVRNTFYKQIADLLLR